MSTLEQDSFRRLERPKRKRTSDGRCLFRRNGSAGRGGAGGHDALAVKAGKVSCLSGQRNPEGRLQEIDVGSVSMPSVSVHVSTTVRVFVFPLKIFFFQTEAQKTEMVPKGQSPFVL